MSEKVAARPTPIGIRWLPYAKIDPRTLARMIAAVTHTGDLRRNCMCLTLRRL